MNKVTLKWLAIATVGLLFLMVLVDRTDRSDTVSGGEYLFPELKDHINDIDKIVVTTAADTDPITIERDGGRWQVREKGGYPAEVGKIREILLAIADARKLEKKTADPERWSQLGLEGPGTGDGTMLEISGTDIRHTLIIGNIAQTKNRYVRLADDKQSWLIDRNPDLPAGASGWLASKLLDIDTSRIQSVEIRHADGETIRLRKESPDDANFAVLGIPQGRELSYATVANGIAGVLNDLKLDDVRPSDAGILRDPKAEDIRQSDTDELGRSELAELLSTSVFTTFDGLEISVLRYRDDEAEGAAWMTFTAAHLPKGDEDSAPAEETATDEIAIDDTSDESDLSVPTEEEARTINAQHALWQYRIPDYKANLLARRWDDILKEKE